MCLWNYSLIYMEKHVENQCGTLQYSTKKQTRKLRENSIKYDCMNVYTCKHLSNYLQVQETRCMRDIDDTHEAINQLGFEDSYFMTH